VIVTEFDRINHASHHAVMPQGVGGQVAGDAEQEGARIIDLRRRRGAGAGAGAAHRSSETHKSILHQIGCGFAIAEPAQGKALQFVAMLDKKPGEIEGMRHR
jgi:hypothetical protein